MDDENLKGTAWAPIDSSNLGMVFRQLTCGKRGQLMAIDENNNVHSRDGVIDALPQGSSWTTYQQSLKWVSYGLDGYIWGVGERGDVFYREGISQDSFFGSSFTNMQGHNARMISVGDCQVFMTNL
jgi:hypothetical protein